MSVLVAARIMPDRNLADEVQGELTWESLDVKKGDWGAVGRHMAAGTKLPMKQHKEIRSYPSESMALAAIRTLSPSLASV